MSAYYWSSTSSTDPTVGANWTKSDGTTGTAPTTGDDVTIAAIPGVTLANIGISDMHTVTLNSLTISQTYTGTIGASGFGGYWQIAATTWTIGVPANSGAASAGSGRIKLNFGSVLFTGTVLNTGQSADSGQEPVRIIGTNASNSLTVMGGTVGVATNTPGEAATLLTANVSGTGAMCNCSSGVTLTNASVNVASGGALNVNSAIGGTGIVSVGNGANFTSNGSGAIATISSSGTVKSNSSGTVTAFNNYNLGKADFSGSSVSRTVTTMNSYPGSTILRAPTTGTSSLIITTHNKLNVQTESYA